MLSFFKILVAIQFLHYYSILANPLPSLKEFASLENHFPTPRPGSIRIERLEIPLQERIPTKGCNTGELNKSQRLQTEEGSMSQAQGGLKLDDPAGQRRSWSQWLQYSTGLM
ncbi:hypothetical protein Pst134EA_000204 [Puccinia striiformis f. sp. tritici]|uniref:hypothetical protein n=1 Tax=Puccinia striiformis f. sp. tritici TaxID=168172 RepID=UPI002008DC94|nr:hypothetical protein Pst134EA_000204 [Puccinia striiformis f. sp. tritici]KAH9473128.1 hypothetical protein Pst134EA_000204 [Puccinia striiformis f. sp. tritici]